MDNISRQFYELRCRIALLEKRGNEYQNFFSQVMGFGHGSDFICVKPWGKQGDEKCDGYLQSRKQLFQLYAPNEMEAAKAKTKIEEDFAGALLHWNTHISQWTFVHNAWDGLGPTVTQTFLSLKSQHPLRLIDEWGPQQLQDFVMALDQRHLLTLFGDVPTRRTIQSVRLQDLQTLLNRISIEAEDEEVDLRPVPKDKIDFNGLSSSVKALFLAGRQKDTLVERTLVQWPALGYSEQLAAHFHQSYLDKRDEGMAPDAIFGELMEEVTGNRGDPAQTASALALLAHLFFNCDIFERVPVA